jgi:predicted peroxiredoxin
MKSPGEEFEGPVWRAVDGSPLSCREKIKVMNENLGELRQMAQDALEDGVLMGADEQQVRGVLREIVEGLVNPYAKTGER